MAIKQNHTPVNRLCINKLQVILWFIQSKKLFPCKNSPGQGKRRWLINLLAAGLCCACSLPTARVRVPSDLRGENTDEKQKQTSSLSPDLARAPKSTLCHFWSDSYNYNLLQCRTRRVCVCLQCPRTYKSDASRLRTPVLGGGCRNTFFFRSLSLIKLNDAAARGEYKLYRFFFVICVCRRALDSFNARGGTTVPESDRRPGIGHFCVRSRVPY